ncbi:hypothetical protein LTR37_009354 [Vermiconidia calcicola]|uniref:Uncharacterized protein n=1 Tax=Vermiconidia calcicola TaxID=1690605 RepID=A0ACC3NAP6_9PEZI|nr:hypothetical protein LTR37_009354 [Vermiconidia calcicola]
MQFLKQTWTLTQKDLLLVARRSWLSTASRAIVLPIILTVVLSYLRIWLATSGNYGIGVPHELRSLSDALSATGHNRNKFVIVDNNLDGDDVQTVINQLSSTFNASNKKVYITHDSSKIQTICPASNKGVTDCYGAVVFWSSPDHGNIWNYTLYQDSSMSGGIDVFSDSNDIELYTLPLQHAIDSAITSTHGGSGLPNGVLQYSFTDSTEREAERYDLMEYEQLAIYVLAFAFFIGICGITYHLTGHIVRQREGGMLQLIDAMMPNSRRWECLAARILSSHLAFDMIYTPGWIAMGAIAGSIAFPKTGPGFIILTYILAGLALTSYSILASSVFRRAQISAMSTIIAAVAFAIVAQFQDRNTLEASKSAVIATGLLFPPCTFVYVLQAAASFEYHERPLDIHRPAPLDSPWNLSVTTWWGFFVLQIVLYPMLGALLEKYLHGTSSRARHLRTKEDMAGNAVRLSGFTKEYSFAFRKRDRVTAVKDMTLDLHAGSISVLLGSNGSGKSTTLNAIAGLETITDGQIEIDGTGGIGICPQKNVIWNAMTVQEHVSFFERLKNPNIARKQCQEAVWQTIQGCGLDKKTDAKADTLSGGQKRRLQLAMMLAGGSRVCCIDEASSGIDPLARRGVWDILLQERGSRTMLLTTHFLDEAEVLSDHVAILSKGQLKAEGTVAALKNRMGGGYQVAVPHQGGQAPIPSIDLPDVGWHTDYNETVFDVPRVSTLPQVLEQLDRVGISGYRIHGPTIEDVFLKLAEEMKNEDVAEEGLVSVQPKREVDHSSSNSGASHSPTAQALNLNAGKGSGPLKQTWIMFRKRLIVLKHNYMPYVAVLFVPLCIAGLVTRFVLKTYYPNGLPCRDPQAAYDYYGAPYGLDQVGVTDSVPVFGPLSAVSVDSLRDIVPNISFYSYSGYSYHPRWNQTTTVPTYEGFQVAMNPHTAKNTNRWLGGGFFIGEDNITFGYNAEGGIYTICAAQATLDMALSNTSIAFSYQGFAPAFSPGSFSEGIVAVFTALGFAIYPAFSALYPTAERLTNVRAMQYSNGILASSLWMAYALFDFIFILLVSLVTVVMWSVQYAGWYGLGHLFV